MRRQLNSVTYATAFIGFFYLHLHPRLRGDGVFGSDDIKRIEGGNMAAPINRNMGGNAFLGFIAAVSLRHYPGSCSWATLWSSSVP